MGGKNTLHNPGNTALLFAPKWGHLPTPPAPATPQTTLDEQMAV